MMETRSFAGEGITVGEWSPTDLEGLEPVERDRVIYGALVQVHACFESHKKDQAAFNSAATEKRQALADDVLDVKSDVIAIRDGLATLVHSLGGQMQAGTVTIKAKMGWRDLLKFAGAAGGALAFVVFLVQLTVHMGPSIQSGFAAAIAYIMGLDPV